VPAELVAVVADGKERGEWEGIDRVRIPQGDRNIVQGIVKGVLRMDYTEKRWRPRVKFE
jgi:hypothetical protein